MHIDTNKIATMTAANQNFSAVARRTDLDGDEHFALTEDEKIDVVARRIMQRHKAAFLKLAKNKVLHAMPHEAGG